MFAHRCEPWSSLTFAAVSVVVSALATGTAQGRSTTQMMIEEARRVLVSLRRDPSRYDARVVRREPLNYYLKVPLDAAPAKSVLFVPKFPTDYPLWVSHARLKQVEWWEDKEGYGTYQSEAIRNAAAEAWPGVLDPYNPLRYGLRVFEKRDCLVFVFWPHIEPVKDHVFFAPDTIVALDKKLVRRSDACDAGLRTFSVVN